MARYMVYSTATFDKLFAALDRHEQAWIEDLKANLESQPTGKPLGAPWFREKKCRSKRLYFLLDEGTQRILFVAFAPKKEQKAIVRFVQVHRDELLAYLRGL